MNEHIALMCLQNKIEGKKTLFEKMNLMILNSHLILNT